MVNAKKKVIMHLVYMCRHGDFFFVPTGIFFPVLRELFSSHTHHTHTTLCNNPYAEFMPTAQPMG